MIELIAALLMAAATPATKETASDRVELRVRAYAHTHVDEKTTRAALEVADELLRSAGLVVVWRLCLPAESCAVDDALVSEIVVVLSSRARPNGRENCGLAARAAPGAGGTVLASVPCLAGVAFRLARHPATNTHPLLAVPRHHDLVGAVVAHEIGHLLGVRHARAGLMRETLDVKDIVALRRGKLRFSAAEAGRMRIAASLAGQAERTLARVSLDHSGSDRP